MSIWTFSRYWRWQLMRFPLGVLDILEKEPMVDGKRPEFTIIAFVAAVRLFWLRNFLQPKMRCRFRDLDWVWFLHGYGVDNIGIGGRLIESLWTRLRMQTESGSTEFLWSVALLGSVGVIFFEGWDRKSMFIEGCIEAWDEMDSSSDEMMWGHWGVGSGLIV